MGIYLERITREHLYIALEIVNSNPEYNIMENGIATRSEHELVEEFLNTESISQFIKIDDTYIGIIDYMMENPKDHIPWIGLLMIHGDYHGYGFGSKCYKVIENELVKRGTKRIRLGVIKENTKDHLFWKSLGFNYCNTFHWKYQKEVCCYEKILEITN